MPFNVNTFRSSIPFDGARASLFEVRIFWPSVGVASKALAEASTPFRITASELPESRINTLVVPYFGRQIKLAGNRVFAPWQIRVIEDEDFTVRQALEEWSQAINSHVPNVRNAGLVSPNQYKTTAEIIQYGKANVPLRQYNFNGIFPQAIGPISTNWAADELDTYQVLFEYDWWELQPGITSPTAGSTPSVG